MTELFKLTSIKEARNILNNNLKSIDLKIEMIPANDSLGRVLAEDIISNVNVPNFSRSTMDGYAVRAADTFGSTEAMPAMLEVKGEVFMGQGADVPVKIGQAVKIPTGGMLPDGADAVVMVEYTEKIDENTLLILKPVAPGENTVRKGEDIAQGEVLLKAGVLIRPQDIGAMAGIGVLKCPVYIKPRVGIISTGDEIVPPEQQPGAGQVRDINSYTLAGIVNSSGGIAIHYGIIKDEAEILEKAMLKALNETDIVVISGGSSVGTRDVTSTVINRVGSPGVLVHGVSVKPGKPTILGVVKGKPVLGLPGHPVSAMVLADIFLVPLIRLLGGHKIKDSKKIVVKAKMGRSIASTSGRTDYIRVTIENTDEALTANPVLGKSGLINTMIKADGFVIIPMSKEGVESGEEVEVRLF